MMAQLADGSLLALGGAFGALTRFWIAERLAALVGGSFPWATLIVNVSGAALIGSAAAFAGPVSEGPGWLFLVTGVLGSYTTVSAFSLQTLVLLQSGRAGAAAGNIAASMLGCLAAAMLGHAAVLAWTG